MVSLWWFITEQKKGLILSERIKEEQIQQLTTMMSSVRRTITYISPSKTAKSSVTLPTARLSSTMTEYASTHQYTNTLTFGTRQYRE